MHFQFGSYVSRTSLSSMAALLLMFETNAMDLEANLQFCDYRARIKIPIFRP